MPGKRLYGFFLPCGLRYCFRQSLLVFHLLGRWFVAGLTDAFQFGAALFHAGKGKERLAVLFLLLCKLLPQRHELMLQRLRFLTVPIHKLCDDGTELFL